MSKTHDYTNGNRRWGHDIGWKVLDAGAKRLDAHGWGVGIELGDYVLLSNGSGTTRYQFQRISYFGDPHDMWEGILVFAPRPAEGQP